MHPKAVEPLHGGRIEHRFLRIDATTGGIKGEGDPSSPTHAATRLVRAGYKRTWTAWKRLATHIGPHDQEGEGQQDEGYPAGERGKLLSPPRAVQDEPPVRFV